MESVFKYIFAMIAGAFILLFFVNFAMKYISSEENVEAAELVSNFDNQLSIVSTSENGFKEHNLGLERDISFNRGRIVSGTAKKNSTNIVYSPKSLQGVKILLWTKKWVFPYAIDSFYYMSNDKYKYVAISDETSQEFVDTLVKPKEGEISDSFKAVSFTFDKFQSQQSALSRSYSAFKKVRIAYFSDNPSKDTIKKLSSSMKNADVIVIKRADTNDGEWSAGTVSFGQEEAIYVGLPMMIGAIFAEDFENYDFNLKRALGRFREVTGLYMKKAEFMQQRLPSCEGYTGSVGIGGLLKSIMDLGEGDAAKYAELSTALEESNKQNFGADCPSVF